jgi:hypothetical protein
VDEECGERQPRIVLAEMARLVRSAEPPEKIAQQIEHVALQPPHLG